MRSYRIAFARVQELEAALDSERARREEAERERDSFKPIVDGLHANVAELVRDNNATLAFLASARSDAERARGDLERALAEIERKEAAICWALGERGDFPVRQPGQGAYWWRTELRRRSTPPSSTGAESGSTERGATGAEEE